MAERERIGLARECAVFTRHITGAPPPDYVLACYFAAHEHGGVDPPRGADGLDALLLRVASSTALLTPAADVYARLFRKGGTLRRKLVLLAAILESAGATHRFFEPPSRPGLLPGLAALAGRGSVFFVYAAAALLLFAPAHALLRLTGRTRVRPAVVITVHP